MTLLEETHARHKAFHQRIAVRAANLPPPKSLAIVPAPKIEPISIASRYRIDGAYEGAWHSEICGGAYAGFIQGDIARFKAIKRAVCENYSFNETVFTSKRREHELAQARQVAMYLGRNHTALSCPHIGRLLGNRDHTTVLHGIRRITELRETDSHMRARIELLQLRLGLAEAANADC